MFLPHTLFSVSRTAVNLRGCCGWFSRTSLVYVCVFFFFLLRVTLVGFGERLSVLSPLICGCGGKFSFGIWVHAAWKPRSQHFISEWGQLCHTSHNGCTHIHKHPLTHSNAHTHTHTHTHTLTQFSPARPIRVKCSRSPQKWVGELLKQKSVSGHTKFLRWSSGELFWLLPLSNNFPFFYPVIVFFLFFFYWTLGSISSQHERGMAELVRIRKKRLQIPISR